MDPITVLKVVVIAGGHMRKHDCFFAQLYLSPNYICPRFAAKKLNSSNLRSKVRETESV